MDPGWMPLPTSAALPCPMPDALPGGTTEEAQEARGGRLLREREWKPVSLSLSLSLSFSPSLSEVPEAQATFIEGRALRLTHSESV
jgi:hypothetical protein